MIWIDVSDGDSALNQQNAVAFQIVYFEAYITTISYLKLRNSCVRNSHTHTYIHIPNLCVKLL